MINLLDNIAVVLSHTSHPGNIGAAARSIKNMGLKQLILVSPLEFPSDVAVSRASGATDILDNAIVHKDLDSALKGFTLVYGVSGKHTSLPWPEMNVKNAASEIINQAKTQKIALLFGNEQTGLLMSELERCRKRVFIPANPEYDSLNLAQAVQIVTYEVYSQVFKRDDCFLDNLELITDKEREDFFKHLQDTLINLEFLNVNQPKKLLSRLKRLYNRVNIDKTEMNILRGILTATNKKIAK